MQMWRGRTIIIAWWIGVNVISQDRIAGSVIGRRSMIVYVKVTVVGLSFCWRGGRGWIQPIQLYTKAEIVCPDEVLAQSVCEKTIKMS